MQTQKFSFRKRLQSFRFAISGLLQFFHTQHNVIIHAVVTGAVILVSLLVKLPLSKFLFVVVAIGLVWVAELFNTAIEKLCDMICPEQHPQIKFIKDVSAAAVLITAGMAVVTACIIFIPVFI